MNIPKLGSILEEQGRLSPEVLEEALEAQTGQGERLGQILIQQKKITEAELLEAIAIQLDLEILDSITDEQLSFDLVSSCPSSTSRAASFSHFRPRMALCGWR